ncbi:hypothetical protein LTR60_000555 [Cryomyces antarcticus]|nr:hypothetical protein LTR60_000555 [Cryomyces antarcticus]
MPVYTYSTPPGVEPYTTLCDGLPRAHGTASYYYINTTITDSINITTVSTNAPPGPSCTLGCNECSQLWDIWDTELGRATELLPACDFQAQRGCPFTTTTTSCNPATAVFQGYGTANPNCFFEAQNVQLAFWPVSTKPDNISTLCGGHQITVKDNATGIVTALALGTTLTSPTVYVMFSTLYALDACGNTLGTPLSNYVLPQSSSQISTQCGRYHAGLGIGSPMNFADMNSPVPWSAYSCMPQCGQGGGEWKNFCSTIWDDFLPQLAYPTDVNRIQPEWKSCTFMLYGNFLFDPPIALQPASVLATPTPLTSAATAPASPLSIPTIVAQSTQPAPPSPKPTVSSAPISSASPGSALPSSGTSPVADNAPAVESSPVLATASSPPSFPSSASFIKPLPSSPTVRTIQSADPSTEPATAVPSRSLTPSPVPSAGGSAAPTISTVADPAPSTAVSPTSINVGGVIASILGSKGNPASASTAAGPGSHSAGSQQSSSTAGSQSFSMDPSSQASNIIAKTSVTAGGIPIAAGASSGVVVVAGSTLQAGDATVINNVPVSVASNGIVVGGSTITLNPTPTSTQYSLVATAGGNSLTTTLDSGVTVVNAQTLSPGYTTVIDNTPLSVGSKAVVVAGSTMSFLSGVIASATPFATIGGQTVFAGPTGAVVIGEHTLTLVETTAANNMHVTSLALPSPTLPNALSVLSAAEAAITQSAAIVTIGGQIYTARPGGILEIASSVKLSVGGPDVTVAGRVVSLGSSGIVVDSSTVAFSAPQAMASQLLTAPVAAYSTNSNGAVVVDGSTLRPGGAAATLSGQTISAASSGVVIVKDGQTYTQAFRTVASSGRPEAAAVTEAVLTIGASTYTASERIGSSGGRVVVIGSSTLTIDGAPITVNGQTISAAPAGLVVGGGSRTTVVPFHTTTVSNNNNPTGTGSSTLSAGSPATVPPAQTSDVSGATASAVSSTSTARSSGAEASRTRPLLRGNHLMAVAVSAVCILVI